MEIQGKFILVQVRARFELARVQAIGTRLYYTKWTKSHNQYVSFKSKLTKKVMLFLDHVARQSSGNGGLRPPKRPSHGTVGRPIKLRANFFQINVSPKLTYLYHYDVEITPNKCPKVVKRDVVNQIIQKYKKETFQGHEPAFDGEKNLYSSKELPSPVSQLL